MFRDDAHKMLLLLAQFQSEKPVVKIVSLDTERTRIDLNMEHAKVKLQFKSGDTGCLGLWEAAKVIEALS